MSKKILGIVCAILAAAILWWPGSEDPGPRPPGPGPAKDLVSVTFDVYEDLWRKHATDTADKIKAGEFETDQEVWDYIAAAQAPARRVAFDDLAKSESEFFKSQGGWSLEAHETLLRKYAKESKNE